MESFWPDIHFKLTYNNHRNVGESCSNNISLCMKLLLFQGNILIVVYFISFLFFSVFQMLENQVFWTRWLFIVFLVIFHVMHLLALVCNLRWMIMVVICLNIIRWPELMLKSSLMLSPPNHSLLATWTINTWDGRWELLLSTVQ